MEAFLTSKALATTTSLVLAMGPSRPARPEANPGRACHAPSAVDQVVVPVADGATGSQVGLVHQASAASA